MALLIIDTAGALSRRTRRAAGRGARCEARGVFVACQEGPWPC